MSNMVMISGEINEGSYGDGYCSLIDEDSVASYQIDVELKSLLALLEKIKTCAKDFGRTFLVSVSDLVEVTFLDEEGNAVEPQYQREAYIHLSSDGYCEVFFESKHSIEDFWRLNFGVTGLEKE